MAKNIKDKGARKVGALSTKDQIFILENIEKLGIEKVATALNRQVGPIMRFLDKKGIAFGENAEEKERRVIAANLKRGKHWGAIKEEFTESEIKYFEKLWIDIFLQFDNDVNATEELQIKKYITLKIIHSRALKRLTAAELEIQRLRSLLDREYLKEDRDHQMIAHSNQRINDLNSAMISSNKELLDIIANENKIEQALKISRDQRVQSINDATKNWSNILRLLQDNTIRTVVGEHIELMRAAKVKEFDRLSSSHKFVDGIYDRPILTSETLEE